jgi:hypothetical protein
VVACHIEVLLAIGEIDARNALLKDAFGLIEAMLSCRDKNVRDLAYVQLLENADQPSCIGPCPSSDGLPSSNWTGGNGTGGVSHSRLPLLIDQTANVIDLSRSRRSDE